MLGENAGSLRAFLAVARERSFTRAAAQMGMCQSALSHAIRRMEARLGVRLLTRSVAPTEAGERLFRSASPRFEEFEAELASLAELRHKPAGTVRITATDYVADTVLWPQPLPDDPRLRSPRRSTAPPRPLSRRSPPPSPIFRAHLSP